MKLSWNGFCKLRRAAQPISTQACSSPQLNFDRNFLFFTLLIAKDDQPSSRDQKGRIWGGAIAVWGFSFLNATVISLALSLFQESLILVPEKQTNK